MKKSITLVLLASLGTGPALAQTPASKPAPTGDAAVKPARTTEPAAKSARTADAILADYATAVGGASARKKKSVHLKLEIEAKGMNVRGSEERWMSAPANLLSVTTLPGVGTFRQGANARVRWAEDPINGLRILKGVEDAEARMDATWDADLKAKQLFKKVVVVPPPEGAPANVECLELTPPVGKPRTACFDATTHLRVFQKGVRATPQGEVPYMVQETEWREVEGVKVPHLESMTAGPLTLEGRLVQITFGEKMPPAMFQAPKPPTGK
jgi:zinc protease